MIASFRFIAPVLLALFAAQPVAAAGLGDDGVEQPQEFPGYCLQDWQDEVTCMDGSREAWRGPQLVPAVAQILARESRNAQTITQRHVCSAVLIAPDWALTAAHCVDGAGATRRFDVGIGFADRETGDMTDAGVALPVKQVVLHPDYRTKSIDLALVRFARDEKVHIANPTYSPLIDPQLGTVQLVFPRPPEATFPAAGEPDVRFADVHGGQSAREFTANSVLFRWSRIGGDRYTLVKTPLFQLPTEICNQQTGAASAVDYEIFCGLSHERVLCPSDSGAPVMGGIESGSYNSHVGNDRGMPHALLVTAIATWDRDGCAAPGEPGRFVLLRPQREWLREVVKDSYDKRKKDSDRIADRDKWVGARAE